MAEPNAEGAGQRSKLADHAANPSSLSAARRDFSTAHVEERTPQ